MGPEEYLGYIGVMEKKMETTIETLGFGVPNNPTWAVGLGMFGFRVEGLEFRDMWVTLRPVHWARRPGAQVKWEQPLRIS